MQTKRRQYFLPFILCIVLTAAIALFTTGCNGTDTPPSGADAAQQDNSAQLGEGSTKFDFTVVDKEGTETNFEIHTDKETVGEALLELGIIAGEESQYGLFVKTVNGITADYDKDGAYWAFYINDEYAQTSVDMTKIEDGASYSFRIE